MQVTVNHTTNINSNDAANGTMANRYEANIHHENIEYIIKHIHSPFRCAPQIGGQFPAQKTHRMVVGLPQGNQQFQLSQVCVLSTIWSVQSWWLIKFPWFCIATNGFGSDPTTRTDPTAYCTKSIFASSSNAPVTTQSIPVVASS